MIATAQKTTDFAAARRHMIESQLRTSGVNDSWVLERMAAVPREDFVPEAARAGAYVDRTVPLGDGAFLAPPLAQGLILTHARPDAADRALLVGPRYWHHWLATLSRRRPSRCFPGMSKGPSIW